MAQPTSSSYITNNDFEGAKERFVSANSRWKQHWFNTCVEIAKNCKVWFDKYILDPVNLTITEIVKKAKSVIKNCNETSNVYLIKMFDVNDRYVFLKGGKADNVSRRLRDLSRQEYKRDNIQISRVEIIKTWELPNSHLAESFEQALHAYLCNFFENIPNDRYYPTELTEEQFSELDRRYEIIQNFAQYNRPCLKGRLKKKVQKIFTNPLTNCLFCGII